jgi:hypothetical protein
MTENDGNDRTRLRWSSWMSGEALGSRSPVHGLFHIIDSSDSTWPSLPALCGLEAAGLRSLNDVAVVGGLDSRRVSRRCSLVSLEGEFPILTAEAIDHVSASGCQI